MHVLSRATSWDLGQESGVARHLEPDLLSPNGITATYPAYVLRTFYMFTRPTESGSSPMCGADRAHIVVHTAGASSGTPEAHSGPDPQQLHDDLETLEDESAVAARTASPPLTPFSDPSRALLPYTLPPTPSPPEGVRTIVDVFSLEPTELLNWENVLTLLRSRHNPRNCGTMKMATDNFREGMFGDVLQVYAGFPYLLARLQTEGKLYHFTDLQRDESFSPPYSADTLQLLQAYRSEDLMWSLLETHLNRTTLDERDHICKALYQSLTKHLGNTVYHNAHGNHSVFALVKVSNMDVRDVDAYGGIGKQGAHKQGPEDFWPEMLYLPVNLDDFKATILMGLLQMSERVVAERRI